MRTVIGITIGSVLLVGWLWACGSSSPTTTTTTTVAATTTTTAATTTTTVPARPNSNPGGPYQGIVGRSITFDGSGSTGSSQLNYFWDFGDGSDVGRGPMPTHTYQPFCDVAGPQTERTFTVSLQVRDDFAQEDTDSTTALILCPY